MFVYPQHRFFYKSFSMKNVLPVFFLTLISSSLFAQTKDTLRTAADSLLTLKNITVTAYTNEQTKLKDVASAVSLLDQSDLQRFDQISIVSSLNTVAGVSMEERSPGSYRLSIRGSALRSTFGIANIRIYWDDIPLTNADGTSYLNLIDMNDLQSIEIIKGPPSSLYGASTGGALLLHSAMNTPDYQKNYFNASLVGGMNGELNEQTQWSNQGTDFFSNIQQSHQQQNGYRSYSGLNRDVVKWNAKWKITPKQSLSILAFYSHLSVQSPGGLTLAQLDQDPTQARAVDVQDHISNTTSAPFLGILYKAVIAKNFTNTTSIVTSYTDFTNILQTAYYTSSEWNYMARSVFKYAMQHKGYDLQMLAGGEYAYNPSQVNSFGNNMGSPDTMQFHDLARITQYFVFAQANLLLGKRFSIQTGISRNLTHYWYDRTTVDTLPYPLLENAGPIVTPRIGFSYGLNNHVSVYVTAEKGYSPPTLTEILPATGHFYNGLQPEYGWNYETGIKGSILNNKLDINAAIYYFALKDAIVQEQDSNNVQYYVNAGSTVQKGVELELKYYAIQRRNDLFKIFNISNSVTYQPYYFNQFTIDSSNFSGNRITGVPRFTDVTAIDIKTRQNYFATIILNCVSSIPLNDSNTVYAKPYQLLQIKFGREFNLKKYLVSAYLGIDNVLDENYSLGNDINAFDGHYFNPAPKINFFIGGKVQF